MAKKKFYVVWKGHTPGIYEEWEQAKAQTIEFKGPLYKSFDSLEEATTALNRGPFPYLQAKKPAPQRGNTAAPIKNSIAVDAACSGNPGDMEYRGVYVPTGQELFHIGPLKQGTNNVGEFLALVHGLAFLKQQKSALPIYSDSRNAILWVKAKKSKTKLERTEENEKIFDLIERAEKWLQTNTYTTPIYKWETDQWGEIPADFGRK